MSTKVNVAETFLRGIRLLAKKYRAVLKAFENLTQQIKDDERPVAKIPGVGV